MSSRNESKTTSASDVNADVVDNMLMSPSSKKKKAYVKKTAEERITEHLNMFDQVEHLSDWGFTDTFCHNCHIKNSDISGMLMQCGRCKQAYYCSTKCFNAALPTHQLTCLTNSWTRDPVGTKISLPPSTSTIDQSKQTVTTYTIPKQSKLDSQPAPANVSLSPNFGKGKLVQRVKESNKKKPTKDTKTKKKCDIPNVAPLYDDSDSENVEKDTKNDKKIKIEKIDSKPQKQQPKKKETSKNDNSDSSESSVTVDSDDDMNVVENGDDVAIAVSLARKQQQTVSSDSDDDTTSVEVNQAKEIEVEDESEEEEDEEEEEIITTTSTTSVSTTTPDNSNQKASSKEKKKKMKFDKTHIDGIPEEEDSEPDVDEEDDEEEVGSVDDDLSLLEIDTDDEDVAYTKGAVARGSKRPDTKVSKEEDALKLKKISAGTMQDESKKESQNVPVWPTGKQFPEVAVSEKEKVTLRKSGDRITNEYGWDKPGWANRKSELNPVPNNDDNAEYCNAINPKKNIDCGDQKNADDGDDDDDVSFSAHNLDEIDDDCNFMVNGGSKGKGHRNSTGVEKNSKSRLSIRKGQSQLPVLTPAEREQIRLNRSEVLSKKDYGWDKPDWANRSTAAQSSNAMSESFSLLNINGYNNNRHEYEHDSNNSSSVSLRQIDQPEKKEYKWAKPEWAERKKKNRRSSSTKTKNNTNLLAESYAGLSYKDRYDITDMTADNTGSGSILDSGINCMHTSTPYLSSIGNTSASEIIMAKEELRHCETSGGGLSMNGNNSNSNSNSNLKHYDWEKPSWVTKSSLLKKRIETKQVLNENGDLSTSNLSPKRLLESGKVKWEKPLWATQSPLKVRKSKSINNNNNTDGQHDDDDNNNNSNNNNEQDITKLLEIDLE